MAGICKEVQKNDQFSDTQVMANVLRSGCLEERKVPIIGLTNAQKVTEGAAFLKEPITKKLVTKGHKLTGNLQEIMLPKNPQQTWPSPSPASLFQAVCATEWVMEFFGKPLDQSYTCSIGTAWLSVMARKGCLLANKSSSTLIKVVASAEYAFLGWTAEATTVPHSDQIAYTLVEHAASITWHHIVDLSEWLLIPTEPQLLTEVRGPVGWVKCGNPLPLQSAMCLEGCHFLTNQQMKALVLHLGGQPPKPATQRAYRELLISMCLDGGLQAEALKKMEEKEKMKAEDDEIDSQLSEVLSDLEKEDGNRQDLKEMTQKRRAQNVKRKLAARDRPVEPRKKKKGTGKGKKGKGKGKGKGKKGQQGKRKTANSFMSNCAKKLKAGGGKWNSVDPNEVGPAQPADLKPVEPNEVGPAEPADLKPVEPNEVEPAEPADLKPGEPMPEPCEPKGPPLGEDKGKQEEDAETQAATGGERAGFKRVHRSPEEILSQITPPACVIGLGFNDWRFTSTWKLPPAAQEMLLPPYSQKTMSKTFYRSRPWKEALEEVHRFNWEKFRMVREHLALPSNLVVQTPGVIPERIFESLEPIISNMEEPKQYNAPKKKPKKA